MLEYVYIKLTCGEDIISYKIAESPTTLTLSKPIVIRQTLGVDGNFKPSASAYCGLAKNNVVEVYKSACIFCSDMRDEAKTYYSSLAEQHYGAIEESIASEDYKKPLKTKASKVSVEDSIEESKETIKVKFH